VLTGHEHAYARTCPLHRGRCTPGAPVHVMAGNAGAGFTNNFPRGAGGAYALEGWVDYCAQFVNGYVRVATRGEDGTMLVEAVGTDDGRVFDSAVLALPRGPPSARWGAAPAPAKRAAQPAAPAPPSTWSALLGTLRDLAHTVWYGI
jgi:hypothetical protein